VASGFQKVEGEETRKKVGHKQEQSLQREFQIDGPPGGAKEQESPYEERAARTEERGGGGEEASGQGHQGEDTQARGQKGLDHGVEPCLQQGEARGEGQQGNEERPGHRGLVLRLARSPL
jgi:hypothetical protein